ncbi:MAG: AAA family ATPase [Candidatus Nanopelagicales bacterium]
MHRIAGDRTAELPFALESSGTQSAFVLLHHLLPALQSGGLAVIDEFENDLHPHMLEPILGLFARYQNQPARRSTVVQLPRDGGPERAAQVAGDAGRKKRKQ